MICARLLRPVLLAFLLGLAGILLATMPARAATIEVNTAMDENGTGSACSLREAASAANGDANFGGCIGSGTYGTDTITFNSSLNGTPIALTIGAVSLNSNLQLTGNGASQTIIDGSANSNIFNTGITRTIGISGVTLRNGATTSPGGAISNFATLTITDSVISGNHVTGNNGGAINSGVGSLNLSNSTITNNTAQAGGGIAIDTGSFSITNTTISGNTAISTGGGLRVDSATSGTLSNSTLTGNGGLGGAAITVNSSSFSVANSTISGNTGGNAGGALAITSGAGTVSVSHATFSDNTTTFGARNVTANSGTIQLRGVVLERNATGANCGTSGGTISTQGSNVADDATCFTNTGTDHVVSNVGLGPLADYGGPTQTQALVDGSPAIDVVQGACPTTDQRGLTRSQGVSCDAGAFERQSGLLQFSSPTYSVTESGGNATITVSRSGGGEGTVGATVSTADGSATAPGDYTAVSTAVSFVEGGALSKTVSVPIVNDTLVEGDETVNLALGVPTGGAVLGAQVGAILTIIDDAPPTATPTPTATATATATPTLAVTSTPTLTPTVTPTGTLTPGATPTPTSTPTSTLIPTATSTVTPTATTSSTPTPTPVAVTLKENEDDADKKSKVTDEQRQQGEHTNAGNRADVATEGNVTEVTRTPEGLAIVIANADGLVTVLYPCSQGCPTIRAGDYVQVEGAKDNEQLYHADEVTVTR